MPTIPIRGLDEAMLLKLEAESCRAAKRTYFWLKGAKEVSICGALGQMINYFRKKRNAILKDSELTQEQLWDCVLAATREQPQMEDREVPPGEYNRFRNFLNGRPAKSDELSDWLSNARQSLDLVLRGNMQGAIWGEEALDEKEQLVRREAAAVVAKRISGFFFPRPNDQLSFSGPIDSHLDSTWLFHEELRHYPHPCTANEVCGELRSLAYDSMRGAACKITRVSGGPRFPQLEQDGKLSSTGLATIDAMRAGVRVTYVYPKLPKGCAATEAEQSAKRFQYLVKEESKANPLRREAVDKLLVAVDPTSSDDSDGVRRWAGQYLSPITLFVHYERQLPESTFHDRAREEYLFIVMHPSKMGMRLVSLDNHDRSDFLAWARAFVFEPTAGE